MCYVVTKTHSGLYMCSTYKNQPSSIMNTTERGPSFRSFKKARGASSLWTLITFACILGFGKLQMLMWIKCTLRSSACWCRQGHSHHEQTIARPSLIIALRGSRDFDQLITTWGNVKESNSIYQWFVASGLVTYVAPQIKCLNPIELWVWLVHGLVTEHPSFLVSIHPATAQAEESWERDLNLWSIR